MNNLLLGSLNLNCSKFEKFPSPAIDVAKLNLLIRNEIKVASRSFAIKIFSNVFLIFSYQKCRVNSSLFEELQITQ